MNSDKRIYEHELAAILNICECSNIRGVQIDWDKAEQIAVILDEVERMNQFKWLKDRNELIDLNSWINTLRFYRVELDSLEKRRNENVLANHAKNIAETTIRTATTQEDMDRGQREMNAADALGRGDIDSAFRSLDYFRDR